jgi:serine protease
MTSMRKILVSLIALTATLLAGVPLPIHAQTPGAPLASDTARAIVKLRADSPLLRKEALPGAVRHAAHAQALGQRLGMAMSDGDPLSERAQVVLAKGLTSTELAQRLARESDVEYAVPDERRRAQTAPNDPLYVDGVGGDGPAVGQWYLRVPGGIVTSSLDIETAWNVTLGDPDMVVAVVDTGARFDHPDLLGKFLPGYDMTSDPAAANDGDGRDADASDPGDWITDAEANNPFGPFFGCTPLDPFTGRFVAEDSSWHGTQVSGLIAAVTNNGIGMAGVGPNLRVLPVRVLGKCGGFDSDIIAGMRWAAGLAVPGVPANPHPARVINLSLGGPGPCTAAYADAIGEIAAAGAVIVVAAGNSAGHALGSPANCNDVISVAALRHVGTKVGFSDLGPDVAISAPGGNCVNITIGSPCLYPILTTSDTGTTTPLAPTYTNSFTPSVGTSFAAPLVSGTAALILSVQPSLAPLQVRQTLQATAQPFPTTGGDNGDGAPVPQCTAPHYDRFGNPIDQLQCYCTTDTCGAGMLDAGAALSALQVPETGWWWNPQESGRGFSIELRGNHLAMASFLYADTGGALWYLTAGPMSGGASYDGQLLAFANGQTLTGAYVPNVLVGPVGNIHLSFSDASHGTLSWPGGAVPIERLSFAPGGGNVFRPETGWWWNEQENGRGFFLEIQGDTLTVAGYMYDDAGNPVWYLSAGVMTSPNLYQGAWVEYANGQTLTGAYQAPTVINANVGLIAIQFIDTQNAVMTLPDGRQIGITRFRF